MFHYAEDSYMSLPSPMATHVVSLLPRSRIRKEVRKCKLVPWSTVNYSNDIQRQRRCCKFSVRCVLANLYRAACKLVEKKKMVEYEGMYDLFEYPDPLTEYDFKP